MMSPTVFTSLVIRLKRLKSSSGAAGVAAGRCRCSVARAASLDVPTALILVRCGAARAASADILCSIDFCFGAAGASCKLRRRTKLQRDFFYA